MKKEGIGLGKVGGVAETLPAQASTEAQQEAENREKLRKISRNRHLSPNASEEEVKEYQISQGQACDFLEQCIIDPTYISEASLCLWGYINELEIFNRGYDEETTRIRDGLRRRALHIVFENRARLIECLAEANDQQCGLALSTLKEDPEYFERFIEDLTSLGLPYFELQEAWSKSGKDNDFNTDMLPNISRILSLEKKAPGIAKALFEEFGIADFIRYSDQVLLKQFEERENVETPYGVLVFPRNDHNGAFYHDKEHIDNLYASLGGKYLLRITEAESKRDLARLFIGMRNKYGKDGKRISFAVIGGHGNKDSIQFGGRDEQHLLHVDDLKGSGMQRGGSFFDEQATIILMSCSAGAEGGIAEQLSKELGVNVIAPDKVTYPTSLTASIEGDSVTVSATFNDAEAKQYGVLRS